MDHKTNSPIYHSKYFHLPEAGQARMLYGAIKSRVWTILIKNQASYNLLLEEKFWWMTLHCGKSPEKMRKTGFVKAQDSSLILLQPVCLGSVLSSTNCILQGNTELLQL